MASSHITLWVCLAATSGSALVGGCGSGATVSGEPSTSGPSSPAPTPTTGSTSSSKGPTSSAPPKTPKSPTCTGRSAQPLDAEWTIPSGGVTRVFHVHVPASYDPSSAVPVVLNFHGFTSDAAQEELLSNMNPKSDAEGFVAVYPEGLGVPQSWNAGACCGYAAEANIDDIGFVGTMLDDLESKLCVDAHRVFATGMSNGGFLSQRIGCELASRFAAIAPVAGVLGVPTCTPSRPVPVMEFQGTLDPLVPYDGDPALDFPSVEDTFAGWASRDSCIGKPVQTYSNHDSQCATYEHCAGGAAVTLCTVQGGGHTWPGGLPVPALGYTTPYLSATDAMWTFFEAHPLP